MSLSIGGPGGLEGAAVIIAQAALARANGTVDADKRAHSPGCVAIDQKIADKAAAALSAARAAQQVSSTAGAGQGLSIFA